MSDRLKVLLIVEQCNPDWFSVPLEGYKYYQSIGKYADVTLVTHERNRTAIEKAGHRENVFYIGESDLLKRYYRFATSISKKGRVNWPLHHALTYPVYGEFNHKVYQQFSAQVKAGQYDIVHALTPMMPRYPVKMVKACRQVPFVLGPVNGGVPFPPGFQETARQEFAHFNFLRAIGRSMLPGYIQTYRQADKVLAGSTYTLDLLREMFNLSDDRLTLFYENGIASSFFDATQPIKPSDRKIELLFVGRLVPYKGADLVIEAVSRLTPAVRDRIHLTIVGDGSERNRLETLVRDCQLGDLVQFTGMVPQQQTLDYYRSADVFCFPSIREFGGAVVLEAMACGLPCIVANNGGIGEYVTAETGFKIEPLSREHLTQELTGKIEVLVNDAAMREQMSAKAVARAREFEWDWKAKQIAEMYGALLQQKQAAVVGPGALVAS